MVVLDESGSMEVADMADGGGKPKRGWPYETIDSVDGMLDKITPLMHEWIGLLEEDTDGAERVKGQVLSLLSDCDTELEQARKVGEAKGESPPSLETWSRYVEEKKAVLAEMGMVELGA